MKIKFVSSNKSEVARYICFLARSIQIGKFYRDSYYVIPYPDKTNKHAVYFPNLNYSPGFWKNLEQLKDYSLTQTYPDSLLKDVSKLVSDPASTSTLASSFLNHWPKFLKIAQSTFDIKKLLSQISGIQILLTEYGTAGSFSRTIHRRKFSLYITSRTDLPWQNIYITFLQGLILTLQAGSANDVGTVGYYQRNAIKDFILCHTKLGSFLDYPRPLSKITPQLISDFKDYLSKLGFPQYTTEFSTFENSLTPQERLLWNYLKNHSGQLTGFDSAAEVIWGDQTDQKYSLYALAKLIQNLRKKLRLAGHQKKHIYTLRKQGYLFNL